MFSGDDIVLTFYKIYICLATNCTTWYNSVRYGISKILCILNWFYLCIGRGFLCHAEIETANRENFPRRSRNSSRKSLTENTSAKNRSVEIAMNSEIRLDIGWENLYI